MYWVSDQEFVYRNKFWLWMLDYTAGVPVDQLAPRYGEVIDEFVIWHGLERQRRSARARELPQKQIEVDISPVDFDNQTWYQDALQLVSVAILLRDARSVKRIVRAMDSLRGMDGLYEALIEGYASDPIVLDEVMHGSPYDTLLGLFESETTPESTRSLVAYCKSWYKKQEGARWFDGHLKVHEVNRPGFRGGSTL